MLDVIKVVVWNISRYRFRADTGSNLGGFVLNDPYETLAQF